MQYLHILYTLFIGVVTVVIVLLLLSVFSIPGVALDVRVVQTGSMEPAIQTGSIVVITPSETYAVGDIITFNRESGKLQEPITHRLVEIREEDGTTYYTTKGDANRTRDFEEIRQIDVLGEVRLTVPYIGYVLNLARTPYGFIVLIIIPAVLLIWDEIRKIRHELRKNNEKDTDTHTNAT